MNNQIILRVEFKSVKISEKTKSRINALASILTIRENRNIPDYEIIARAIDSLERELSIQRSENSATPPTPMQDADANLTNIIPGFLPSLAPQSLPKKSQSTMERVAVSEFDLFWKLYPRKIAKAAALKAWLKATKRPALDSITSALVSQIQHGDLGRVEQEFIPHAATWINQERWNDEIKLQQTPMQKDLSTLESALSKAEVLDNSRNTGAQR